MNDDILFLSTPAELLGPLFTIDYIPASGFAWLDYLIWQWIFFTERLLDFLFTIGFGLALVNAAPVFTLDGEYILCNLLHIVFANKGGYNNTFPRTPHDRLMRLEKSFLYFSTCVATISLVFSVVDILSMVRGS